MASELQPYPDPTGLFSLRLFQLQTTPSAVHPNDLGQAAATITSLDMIVSRQKILSRNIVQYDHITFYIRNKKLPD